MVSDCGPRCEESRTTYSLEVEREQDGVRLWTGCEQSRMTYQLEVERERDGVRLWTWMQTEQDNVSTEGGEGAEWC